MRTVMIVPHNHRMIWDRRDIKGHPVPIPAMDTGMPPTSSGHNCRVQEAPSRRYFSPRSTGKDLYVTLKAEKWSGRMLFKFYFHLRTCFSPSREEQSPWVTHLSGTVTGFALKSLLMEKKNHMNTEKVVITSALKYSFLSQKVSSVFTVTQHPLFWPSSNEFTSYGNSSLIWLKQNNTRISRGFLAADTDQVSKLPNPIIISNEKLQTLSYSFQIIRTQSYFL